jgi:hypothetical protein
MEVNMDEELLKIKILDNEHLRLLSIAHFISGGLTVAYSLLLLLQFLFIFSIVNNIIPNEDEIIRTSADNLNHPFFSFFIYFLITFFVLLLTFGILEILSGIFIKRRKNRTFSFIMGILNLPLIPHGTILGICTLSVLSRDSVINLYKKNKEFQINQNTEG